MSVPAEKLDHDEPSKVLTLAEILRQMIDADALRADLTAKIGDVQVCFHLTIAGYKFADGTEAKYVRGKRG